MARRPAGGGGPPSKDEILAFVKGAPGGAGKREIARAFNVKGADRIALKERLREMAEEGLIEKGGKRFGEQGAEELPPTALLEVVGPDADGRLLSKPANWKGSGEPPRVALEPPRAKDPALGPGDRFLGRVKRADPDDEVAYEASILKKLPRGSKRVLGLFRARGKGGRIEPIDKRGGEELVVDAGDEFGAEDGELVEAQALPGQRFGLRKARVVARVGDPSAPRAISLIAIHEHRIPVDFPDDALAEAAGASEIVDFSGRTDLRDKPFVTIDPADARDHDDAVFAEADADPANEGGWTVWVAIADVAAYVRPGSALDLAASERGNSVYFPDRVVPMLPERLSGDLCSLHENVDRPVLASKLSLGPRGALRRHEIHRAVIRSRASLTYGEAQSAIDGAPSERAAALLEPAIAPLFGAYEAARAARDRRAPLELELPEREVLLDARGDVAAVRFRERLDAHKLIEEFMILANVAAAETLEAARRPLLYRQHEAPDPEKLEGLRETLDSIGVPLAKGQVMTTKILNRALDAASGGEHAELVNLSMLRAQSRAAYGVERTGHFGLALGSYAHFTSPIRRYADLTIHRGLIRALGLGADGQPDEEAAELPEIGERISSTERRAMEAERDTIDRYLAAHLADQRGGEFAAVISSVKKFGLFVKLDETGADGFVPVSTLGDERFEFDERRQVLVGRRSGVVFRSGLPARVRLVEAAPMAGGLRFEVLDLPTVGRSRPRDAGRGSGAPKPKRPGLSRGKAKALKAARKSKRR